MSRCASASSRLSLAFSDSSSRRRWASEAGMPIKELCRNGGFSDATFYKWRAKFGGMQASACLRKPMICSSVNLLFFMSVILLVVDGLH